MLRASWRFVRDAPHLDRHAPRVTFATHMNSAAVERSGRGKVAKRWIRILFLSWALFSTLWLANSMWTRGVDPALLRSDEAVKVVDATTFLNFQPVTQTNRTALIFICGSGVAAPAYAPLLHPIAEAGHPVFIIKLPYRFAPFESHKQDVLVRVRSVITAHPEMSHWAISGHSLGGALACRVVQDDSQLFSALVLVGTTHPKKDDLSLLPISVTKVYGSADGVAPPERVLGNKALLPKDTRWVEIRGGNHSQFGHYGRQLLDGKPTISREAQQALTRSAILDALQRPGGQ